MQNQGIVQKKVDKRNKPPENKRKVFFVLLGIIDEEKESFHSSTILSTMLDIWRKSKTVQFGLFSDSE